MQFTSISSDVYDIFLDECGNVVDYRYIVDKKGYYTRIVSNGEMDGGGADVTRIRGYYGLLLDIFGKTGSTDGTWICHTCRETLNVIQIFDPRPKNFCPKCGYAAGAMEQIDEE